MKQHQESRLAPAPLRSTPARAPAGQHGRARPWLLGLLLLGLAGGGAWWWQMKHKAGSDTGAPAGAASAASATAPGAGANARGGGGRRFGGANQTQPVSVQTAQLRDIRQTAAAIGTITAANTAVVRAQVSGVLQTLQFKEGQQIKAGQALAQIDPRAFQATLGQAEGQLARDKATLDNARLDLVRYRDLVAKDAAPKQQLDTQEALVRQLEGTLKADQAMVDSARLQLSYTRVLAPIGGRVGLKQVDIGNIVQQSDANGLVSITQTRPIALLFAVPSALLPQVTAGLRSKHPLAVEAWSRDGKTRLAEGKLATADNAIDLSTDTLKLKALFPNEDDALYPNQSVSVRLQLATQSDQLAVPAAAVQRGAQGFYLYVVNEDSTVATRVVKPGAVDGDWMAIDGPVKAGERVVIDGVDRLREGAKVEVIAADPKQRAGANAAERGRRGGRGASAPGGAASASAPVSTPTAAATAARPASAAQVAGEERPRWLERLPPEVAEKVMKMSPAEREAWIAERRAERAKRDAAAGGN